MLGARKTATGAYTEVREDRGFPGNNADGQFSKVPHEDIEQLFGRASEYKDEAPTG